MIFCHLFLEAVLVGLITLMDQIVDFVFVHLVQLNFYRRNHVKGRCNMLFNTCIFPEVKRDVKVNQVSFKLSLVNYTKE